MNDEKVLINRYTSAFLNLYGNEIEPADLPAINNAIDYFQKHKSIKAMLKIPLIDAKYKINALRDLLIDTFHLPRNFEKLITLLANEKRSFLIGDILSLLYQEYQARAGIMEFDISSSQAFSTQAQQTIKDFLERKTALKIMTHFQVDPALIAGIRMQSNRLLYEYSIAKKLREIRHILNGQIG